MLLAVSMYVALVLALGFVMALTAPRESLLQEIRDDDE